MAFDTQRLWKMLGACLASAALLTACGGGGGGGGDDPDDPFTPPAATKFTLASGYKAHIENGASDDFKLSKPDAKDPPFCSGTASIETKPAKSGVTFEGVTNAFSVDQVSSLRFTDCTPLNQTMTASGTTFYNADYVPIGQSIGVGEYVVFKDLPTATIKETVDSTDIDVERQLVSMVRYENNTQQKVIGSRTVSYVIELDPASTEAAPSLIANIITRSYEDADQKVLASTQESRYRLRDGFTLVSIYVTFESPNATHYRLWYEPT